MHGRAVCTAASKKPTDLYFLKVAFEALFLYMYDVLQDSGIKLHI
jgi:hypothetical protein